MADNNALLITGSFAVNLAILGGLSLYMRSDYINKVDALNSNMNLQLTTEANVVSAQNSRLQNTIAQSSNMNDTLIYLQEQTHMIQSDLIASRINLHNIESIITDNAISFAASSNITVGEDASNMITIQGMPSGSSKLMFGSSLSMSAVGNTNNIVSSRDLVFGPGTSDNMRLTSNGLLGIGLSSPTERLSVNGNVYSTGKLMGSNLCIGSTCMTEDQLKKLLPLAK